MILGSFIGGGRDKCVGVAEYTLPHTPKFEVGTLQQLSFINI